MSENFSLCRKSTSSPRSSPFGGNGFDERDVNTNNCCWLVSLLKRMFIKSLFHRNARFHFENKVQSQNKMESGMVGACYAIWIHNSRDVTARRLFNMQALAISKPYRKRYRETMLDLAIWLPVKKSQRGFNSRALSSKYVSTDKASRGFFSPRRWRRLTENLSNCTVIRNK